MMVPPPGLPADGTAVTLDGADLRVEAGEHPYVLARRADIDANWSQEQAANPHLFNGRIIMQRQITLAGGRLEAVSHVGPFAALLHWRRQGRPAGFTHLFGMALMLSADDRLLAIRMAAHTANPGRIYCPAGSLDEGDVTGGRIDIEANMAREVAEETGLALAEAEPVGPLAALFVDNTVVVTRPYRFDVSARALAQRVQAHMDVDHEQEIAGLVFIGKDDPPDPAWGYFMPNVLAHLFDRKV